MDSDGRHTIRHDGWTVERQLGFLRALADSGSVSRAAAEVGLSPSSAYRRRGQQRNDAFAYGWRAAQAMAYYRLRDIALERIESGVETATTWRGEVVASKRVYSDRLLVALLNHLRPAEATAGPPVAAMDDPGGDYAATVAAYAAAIAAGTEPERPVDTPLASERKQMTRAEFIAAIRARPRLDSPSGEAGASDGVDGGTAADAGGASDDDRDCENTFAA